MDVWEESLGALREIGSWPTLYLLASYLQNVETSRRHCWAMHALWAILSDVQLQTVPILTDLENRNDEYRREISLLLEQGTPLQIGTHVPWIIMSTILCLETNLKTNETQPDPVEQETEYTVISRTLSFTSISLGHLRDYLQDDNSEAVSSEGEYIDLATWISNLMLYLSEFLLRLSYYSNDYAEVYIDKLTCKAKTVAQLALKDPQETEYEPQDKEPTVTQLSEVSFLDILVRCKELYMIADSIRSSILTRLRTAQLDPPLSLQLMTHVFWAPGQSFEDGVYNAKEIYKKLQGLTAVSLSQTSTSDGNFVSPEHLQQECSNHAAYYNTDQLVAARMTCLKALQLLEIAPVLSVRPTSIKKLQRLFLSSLRILEAHKSQEITEPMLQQRDYSSILAEFAGIHKRREMQLVPYLRFSFYRAVLNYYCNTPQNDLYDIILSNLESISVSGTGRIDAPDIHTVLSSVNEYVSVLLKTVDTCVKNICVDEHEWRPGSDVELVGYVDSLYGLLICLPCRPNPLDDLITLTSSTVSLLYYYEDVLLQNRKHVALFTLNLLFKIAIRKLQKLFKELVKLYALILHLEYPVAQLETECFQAHVSRLLVEKLHGQSRLDSQFVAKKAIQQAKALILKQHDEDESAFSFTALAKKVSFLIFQNANDASLQEALQCILLYLMMDMPICLFDYVTTARIVRNLQAELLSTDNLEVLIEASKGIVTHVDQETILNRFDNTDRDIQSNLYAAYSELLCALVLCSEIFAQ